MKKSKIAATLVLTGLTLFMTSPAQGGTKEQLIQLQTTVEILQANLARLQQSFDERMGSIKDLMTQQSDSIAKMGTSVQDLQKTLSQQNTDAAAKVDQLSGQVQALHDSVDELKARLAQTSRQLNDIQAALQNINNPPANQPPGGGIPVGPQAQAQAPPADALYNSALGDFNGGKNDLAAQEFAQYLQFYPNTDRAGNAQFYLGELDYRRGNYQAAISDYNKVLDQYPGGNKDAGAHLKKGFALLELGQRDAGVKELRALITRYPRSPEAAQARDRLNKLGAAGAASNPAKPSPRHL
jgi:tol-pal system protein YbgF